MLVTFWDKVFNLYLHCFSCYQVQELHSLGASLHRSDFNSNTPPCSVQVENIDFETVWFLSSCLSFHLFGRTCHSYICTLHRAGRIVGVKL